MSNHGSQVTWILEWLLALAKVFVWPAFLWFFTKRPDVQLLIGKVLSREIRFKTQSFSLTLKPETVRKLPSNERELVTFTPPRTQNRKTEIFVVDPESTETMPLQERERTKSLKQDDLREP